MTPFFKFQKCSKRKCQPEKKTKEIRARNKFSAFSKIFIFCLLIGSIFLYLVQINSLATKGFKIQKLEKQISELEENNEKLSIEAVKLRSMAELNEKVRNLNMVPVNDFSYIEATTTGVAKR